MKKTVLGMFLMFVLFGSVAYASPDRGGRLDVGVNFSAVFPQDEANPPTEIGENDDSWHVGGTLAYGLNQWLAIGVESGWFETDINDDTRALGFEDFGTSTNIPLFGDVIVRVPIQDQPINPYFVLGLGMIFRDFEESDHITAIGYQLEVDSSFAVKLGGGFDWFFNEHWALNFEAAYVISDTSTTSTAFGVSSTLDNVNADYWTIGGGLKFLF